MRKILINFLIWLLEKDLFVGPKVNISEQQFEGFLAELWRNPGFQRYVELRNHKLIYSMAGAPGAKVEPRDRYMELRGQRVEILELAAKSKACSLRIAKRVSERKE